MAGTGGEVVRERPLLDGLVLVLDLFAAVGLIAWLEAGAVAPLLLVVLVVAALVVSFVRSLTQVVEL